MNKDNFFDLILLSKKTYARFTNKLITLYLGIIFVGITDVIFDVILNYKAVFLYKTGPVLFYNCIFIAIIIVFMGLIDNVFFAVPLYDLFKRFRIESDILEGKNKLIKLMKVYIVAHFIIVIFRTSILLLAGKYMFLNQTIAIGTIGLIIISIVPIWFCSAVTRGINVIYAFSQKHRSLIFIIVFGWFSLVDVALGFLQEWIMKLLK